MTGESLWSSHLFHFFSSPTIIPTSNILPPSSCHYSSSFWLSGTRKSLPFLVSTSRNCSMDVKGKQRSMVVKKEVNGEEEWSDEDIDDGFEEQGLMGGDGDESDQNGYKRKRLLSSGGRRVSVGGGGGGGGGLRCCQAENCSADLTDSKPYHRRHKVCEHHAKAQVAVVGGIRQRFCQQCSRFHELAEFDETKRSCRRRLAGHNERRRKNSAESHAEGSGSKGAHLKDMVCGQVDDRGRIKITIQDHATYKHFQIS